MSPVLARLNSFSAGLLLSCATLRGADTVEFNRDIRPLLSDRCFYCHGPDEKKREAKLRLDTRDGATADLGGYAAIVPASPEKSELLARVTSHDRDEVMPPPKAKKSRFTAEEVATLRRWIAEGARYEAHWAFLPLRDFNSGDSIDAFIGARLASDGLALSPEADRATLIRRVSLDLTGLLSTPEETAAFIRDHSPDAYEKLVARLLASPHYGERWGRHWLDQARYADSNGYSIDAERAMWPYRDWVIKALNDDMPFDRFTIEQLAGDQLPTPTKAQLVATGFHRNTLINQEGGTDAEQFRVEAAIDRVNTTGAVWLGLTVGCAQCHTHKFDPITQREFYELFAFFNQGEDKNNTGPTVQVVRGEMFGQPVKVAPATPAADVAKLQAAWEAKESAKLEKTAKLDPQTPREKFAELKGAQALLAALRVLPVERTAEEKKAVLAAFEKAEPKARKKTDPNVAAAMIMRDLKTPRPTYLLTRGDFTRPDKERGELQPGIIAALETRNPKPDTRTRLDLARWLVSPENPLTPRVTLNRMWMRYFGRGLVETEEDFGTQGTAPTHPELLDWLAREFIRSGWSMKAMHRLIVTSATYRQSSNARPDAAAKDPRNLLLARQERLRVEAEIVRDAALSASGLLDRRIGGPSVHPPQPEGVYAFTQNAKKWATDTGPDRYRRALYTMFYRSAPHPLFGTFDAPDFQTTCTRRIRSNTPLQALTLANDPAFLEIAQALAARVVRDIPRDDLDARVRRAFQLALCREPDADELAALTDYARRHDLAAVARVLFNTDNFITRE
ncbi:MAG: DUF1553 domain-containing protein [Chthoniobacteraceae bacterium]